MIHVNPEARCSLPIPPLPSDKVVGGLIGWLVGVAGLKEQKKAHPADALLLHHHHSSSADDGMDLIRWEEAGVFAWVRE